MEGQSHMSIATPDDYLEKIFQVPFWIKPLGKEACEQLVSKLTAEDLENVGSNIGPALTPEDSNLAQAQPKEAPKIAIATLTAEAAKLPPAPASPVPPHVADDVWRPVEPNPRSLVLTAKERQYMVTLAPLIGRSPRAVKRFVNCYRLLKSTLDPIEIAQAQEDKFQPTMFLLALVTGYPEAAQRIICDLRAHEGENPAPSKWVRSAGERLNLKDDSKWKELLSLVDTLGKSRVSTIEPLAKASNLVDRFSFNPVRADSGKH
jgi:hypothetical protein